MVRHCLGRVLALDSLTDPELDPESGVGKEALTPALEVTEATGWRGCDGNVRPLLPTQAAGSGGGDAPHCGLPRVTLSS